MFTEADVKNIFNLFPPQKTPDFLPSLTLASSGNGFVTLQFVQAQFRSRVTKDSQRISTSALANELDVDEQLVLQLVRNHLKLALLSADGNHIIAADERDALHEKLQSLLSKGLVEKEDFVKQNNVHVKSLAVLLADQNGEVLSIDDYVCSEVFESKTAEAISSLLTQALKHVKPVDINPSDLPNSPPLWFTLRTLEQLLTSEALAQKFSLQERPGSILCTPTALLQQTRDAKIANLQSGSLAYLDLRSFSHDFPELFPSYPDVSSYFQSVRDVEVTDSFAVSQAWRAKLEQNCIRILEQEGCSLDVSEVISKQLPLSIRERVASTVEENLIAAFSSKPRGERILRAGSFLLTDTRRHNALNELAGYAKADADTQWNDLLCSSSPQKEVKLSLTRIEALIPQGHRILHTLLLESGVKRSLDETFSSTLSTLEAQNEEAFAAHFTSYVLLRLHTYIAGLASIPDQKLASQLEELLAGYMQSDVLPATLREQGLQLSRRTRKNIAKLSTVLEAPLDMSSLTSALDKFSKKQGINMPDAEALEETKKAMIQDMLRDMQRRVQKGKASDGPVLFLLLVIVLFAKQFSGVAYATGKFAPKLLKLMKEKLSENVYEKVESWKEAAKSGTLTAEDKADMVGMAKA